MLTMPRLRRGGRVPRDFRFRPTLRGAALEDRTLLAQSVTLGSLELVAPGNFNVANGHAYSANEGFVDVGFKPVGAEPFHSLLRVDLTGAAGGLLTFDTQDPTKFTLAGGVLDVKADNKDQPAPIWQAPDATTPIIFGFNTLVNAEGVSLNDKTAKPFKVAGVTFVIDTLILANPGGGDTTDSQVKMQGGIALPDLPVAELSKLKVRVDGTDYVTVSGAGVSLSGVHAALMTDPVHFGGLSLQGAFGVGYSDAGGVHTFQFSGNVAVSTQAQGPAGKVALNGVGAGLAATLAGGKLTALGLKIRLFCKACG